MPNTDKKMANEPFGTKEFYEKTKPFMVKEIVFKYLKDKGITCPHCGGELSFGDYGHSQTNHVSDLKNKAYKKKNIDISSVLREIIETAKINSSPSDFFSSDITEDKIKSVIKKIKSVSHNPLV